MPSPEPSRTVRKDVVRNRQALVDAARTAFRDQGLHAPLEPIASAAGLGNATLYRHFPTRAALWEAVLAEPLGQVLDLVQRCRERSEADPWEGFASFIRETSELEAARTGFTELMTTGYQDAPALQRIRVAIQDVLTDLWDRAVAAGVVRPDAALADVALVQLSIAATIRTFTPVAPEVHRRWVDLTLDALRAPGVDREPLRGKPLRGDQVRRGLAGERAADH